MRNMSQDQLAAMLNLTFQQVQKYEKGSNRVSASKLWIAAEALGVPVQFFYEGLGSDADPLVNDAIRSLVMCPEGQDLAKLFPALQGPIRRSVVDLIRTLNPAAAPA
jgi:transcriptional regulator with XRE-family HTH domain